MRETGRLHIAAAIAIVVVGLLVLLSFVIWRQRQQPVASTPAAEDPPPRVSQPADRGTPRDPGLEPERTPPPSVKQPDPARSRTAGNPRIARKAPATGVGTVGARREEEAKPAPTAGTSIPEVRIEPIEIPGDPGRPPSAPTPSDAPGLPPDGKVFDKAFTALSQVLGRYEQAFDRLDASAAAALWPSVDARALARAFARLQQQDLDFGNCTFAVSANDAAARCAGVLHYARRIGDTTPRTEHHVWTIQFSRVGETWQIARISAQ